jgi:DNA-directed RNA polymerase subunit RPC12/RpoP
MSEIEKYIQENNIKPSDCLYHTTRNSKNRKGGVAGRIRVLVSKADSIARCEYMCPECEHESYTEQEWKRPFSVRCENCGFRISVPKMKQEFKRETRYEVGSRKRG